MIEDISGSSLLVDPLERHVFEGRPDDFYCRICKRPRALHLHDAFTASLSNLPTNSFPMKPGWRAATPQGKLLTDKQIQKYQEQGWYSEQFREARRARWQRKGNFRRDGERLIYSPR